MKISYNWLKWYVPELPEAEKLTNVFNYHLCEVEGTEKTIDGDTIFDINILPNRAHDLLSHHGVGMEIAGQLGLAYKNPVPLYKIPESKQTKLEVTVKTDTCRRYMARVVRNVKIGPSPEWVVKHLESIGQRSINNIVDATNLVMFDCGQPCHAFDADKIVDLRLEIREAVEGTKMTLLDSKEVTLSENDAVIADDEHLLAIAGVKGGKHAEVDEQTNAIVLEVGNFDPVAVRKTGQRLGLVTDARKRFENDLGVQGAPFGMMELSALIVEMCPEAEFEDIIDINNVPYQEKKITFTAQYINHLLGSQIATIEMEDIFKRYAWEYTKHEDTFILTVPCMRLDLIGAHDVAEEIGRIIGYDNIISEIPNINFTPNIHETLNKILTARNMLLADGYREVMTYSFTNKGKVEMLKTASDKKFLRTNIADGLKNSFILNKNNLPLLEIDQVRIFEIGTVFPDMGKEEIHVAWADTRGVQEKTLDAFTQEMSFEAKSMNVIPMTQNEHVSHFKPWSVYPFITRDIAVWVHIDITADDVAKVIRETMGTLVVKGPHLFDTFSKDNEISYAFRLVFQSEDRTLTDSEIVPSIDQICQAFQTKGWKIR